MPLKCQGPFKVIEDDTIGQTIYDFRSFAVHAEIYKLCFCC